MIPRSSRLLLVLGLLACHHEAPFEAPATGTEPFGGGNPARLTVSPGADWTPRWALDGDGLWYSAVRWELPTGDRCLVELPPTGGQGRRRVCWSEPSDTATLEDLGWPAPGPDGLVASVFSRHYYSLTEAPVERIIVLWSGNPVVPRRELYRFPTLGMRDSITDLAWASATDLVYRRNDSLVYLLATGQPARPPQRLAIPTDVTALATRPEAGELWLLRRSEPGLYRYSLATGLLDRPAVLAAVQWVGWLTLSAGTAAGFTSVGELELANLADGRRRLVAPPGLRRPALSPDGHHVVAENAAADLILLEVP